MTQEQIQTAAETYAASIAQSEERIRYCAEDFIAGAKWRIDSVWHSVQDMPSRNMRDKVGELCLVETSDRHIEFTQARYESINGVYYFMAYFGLIELFKIKRWAYVSDFMPTEDWNSIQI